MSRHRRQRRRSSHSGSLRRITLLGILVALGALVGGGIYAVSWVVSTANSAPNLSELSPRIQGQLSEVFASDGTLLGYLSTDVLRRALPQSQQPALLRNATVAIEDRNFYRHGGVDYEGLLRAAVDDVLHPGSDTQGGSTLTMQLVKNIYLSKQLTASRSLRYKIIQAKLATELAKRHTRAWILTQYLNDVPYGTVDGQSAYGVAAASQMFFDRSDLARLDLAQVALLAGLPQAPTDYNPFLHPALARQRRSEVLAAMVRSGYVSAAQAAAANASPLQVHQNSAYRTVRQPYVFDYIRQQLIAKLGEKTVDAGGLQVHTSLNLQDQADAQTALEENEGEPGDPQAALVSVDPDNGEIVAMAQNTRYGLGSGETTLNYNTQALRQTGSAFKVFSLMTLIHDEDGDPNATYYTSKFLPAGWFPADPKWSVHTSEESYQGVINVTRATALSDNTVFAQLGVDLGLPKIYATAYAMGITTRQQAGDYPAIIGGLNPGVTPLQMADAYATIDNGGSHYTPTIIDSVTLPSGRTENLLDTSPDRVFTPAETYEATQTLETVLQYGTAAGDDPNGCPAAGKTGTTSNYTDAYFVGYTPKLTTAVWVGYAASEKESMTDVNGLGPGFGGTLAAPIWKDFMEQALPTCTPFPVPATPFVGKPYHGAHAVGGVDDTTTYPGYTGTGTLTGTTTSGHTATGPVLPTQTAAPPPAISTPPPSGGAGTTPVATTPGTPTTPGPTSGGAGVG